MTTRRQLLLVLTSLALSGCFSHTRPAPAAAPQKLTIGLALGGGAVKGFAHIGVIKMLEANGIHADVVAGTSAGSVVGALYAAGMDPFKLQEQAFALDEASLRDVRLFSGGLVQGKKLQNYINAGVSNRSIEQLSRPFAAVATQLETGERAVFIRGNTGQAVRASSSIPGLFEPVEIAGKHYVDGGVVSPVPVDAARQLGANFVIAVDISAAPSGSNPRGLVNIVSQSITIMGHQLGQQELARADVVIRPNITGIGAVSFEQKNQAILEGERATLAAMPAIRAAIAARMSSPIANGVSH